MAKSLKNFITIRQALQGHTARQLPALVSDAVVGQGHGV